MSAHGTTDRLDSLMFAVADMLGLTLYMDAGGTKAEGSMVKEISMGPWKGKTHVLALTDVIGTDSVGVLVKLRKALWMYVVSFHAPGGNQLYAFLFDGPKAGAKTGQMDTFVTGDIQQTLAKIKPHTRAGFRFNRNSWGNVDVADLDGQAFH